MCLLLISGNLSGSSENSIKSVIKIPEKKGYNTCSRKKNPAIAPIISNGIPIMLEEVDVR